MVKAAPVTASSRGHFHSIQEVTLGGRAKGGTDSCMLTCSGLSLANSYIDIIMGVSGGNLFCLAAGISHD